METKNFLAFFLFTIIFIAAPTIETVAQSACPNYSDLLDKGWAHSFGGDPHNPNNSNWDEFAATDPQPFMLKVNDYPPVKSFPIIPHSGCSSGQTHYYFSFDTDGQNYPIDHWVKQNEDNTVKTYRVDQNLNYVAGCSLNLRPPSTVEVGSPPDFVMKYNGSMHDIAWNINIYGWENIVQNVVSYIPQTLSVIINGENNLSYNNSSEYVADINGGGGKYSIKWSMRTLPSGSWTQVQFYNEPENYYNLYGNQYYFYDAEHKYNLTMPSNNIELKVEIYDWITGYEAYATKIINVNPEPVTFINHIETSENYGSLILNENHSDPISSGDSRDLIFGNTYTVRTDEVPFIVDWNSTGKTEKHINWTFNNPAIPPVHLLNYNFTLQASTERTMKSTFLSTQPAVIKTLVDGLEFSGLDLKFNDPWYYYEDPETNNWIQSNEFLPYTSPLEMYNNSPTSYGGIFLNQEVSPNEPYYSVQSPLMQTKNLGGAIGTRNFYFQNWSTAGGASLQQVGSNPPGYDQKAVVFTSAGATVNANLKGQLMSSDQNAISSASQRKIVRTDNGRYHVVYESMGTVWYAHSATSDFYGAWYPEQQLHIYGKNPSIEYDGNEVVVVIEEYNPQVGGNAKVWLYRFTLLPGQQQYTYDTEEVASFQNSYYGNAKPVVSYNTYGNSGEIFIAYRKGINEPIKHKTKWGTNGVWNWGNEDNIPNTDGYCINPSVTGFSPYIKIVYEKFQTIFFREALRSQLYGNYYWNFSNHETNISQNCGFEINQYPVISLSNNLDERYVIVSWVGIFDAANTKPFPKPADQEPLFIKTVVVRTGRVVFGGNYVWSTFRFFGSNVEFTNNASLNNLFGSVVSWSESNGQYSKYTVRRSVKAYDPILPLSDNGIHTLVSNGNNFATMKAMVFNKSTNAPYLLNKCLNDFTENWSGLGKITETGVIDISYGRSGIIEKNGIEFVFNIGDVLLNGETIKFIERADTLPVASIEELNLSVRTDTLTLDSQSELIFSDYYYVVNGDWADSLLSNEFNISFKCELVKLSTGEVIGLFEQVNYNKTNLDEYGHEGYLIDCSGIEPGNYYLRLTAQVNEEVGLSLADIQIDNVMLNKSKLNVRNFKGETMPIAYSLEQNYPNPFNPTTTIRYQLPKDGMVTLKVYDILGAEVATLVNEEKAAGKYELTFDAGRLASGVYIYRLSVNDYVNVKKMLLLK